MGRIAEVNIKRFAISVLAVFLASQAIEFVVHGVILDPIYRATADVWRPDMESYMWIMPVVGVIWSFLLAYIFVKGCEGKGIMEGIRFGLVIGLFVSIPMAYGTYAMIPIPYSLALQWFLYTLVECVVLGVILALIYRPKPAAAA